MVRIALVLAQVGTFAGLGALFIAQGNWRLGVTQLLLGAVNGLVYS